MKWNHEALAPAAIETIHARTLDLLARHGIRMLYEPARQMMADHGAAVDGETVRIQNSLVEKALQTAPGSFTLAGRNPAHTVTVGPGHAPVMAPGAGGVFISDAVNGRRAGTLADLQNLLKLAHTSPFLHVNCPGMVVAGDLDPLKSQYRTMLESIKMSDKPVMALSSNRQIAEDALAMARIACQGQGDCYTISIVNSLSPMAWDDKMLGGLMAFAEAGQPIVMACCSLAGISSHILLAETLIQNHAEIVAGIVLAQLVNPGTPVGYGNTSSVADMRTMGLSIGAPEYALLSSAAIRLARMIGVPCRTAGGLTDAKAFDPQAGMEATFNHLFLALNDVDFVLHGFGEMESFSAISMEKWILDEEIRGRVLRLQQGIPAPADDAVDLIAELSDGNQFIMHESTLTHCRETHYNPLISDRNGIEGWEKADITMEQRATKMWQERVAAYQQPEMDTAVLEELEAFVAAKTAA